MSSFALLAALAGCSGSDAQESDWEAEEDSTRGIEEPLTTDQFCQAVNAVGTIDIGGAAAITPQCQKKSSAELSYLGSTPPASFSKSISRVNAQALYCALKGSSNVLFADPTKNADATKKTAIGLFGMTSRLNVYKTDPVAMKLTAQRLGRLYAFGQALTLENQTLDWSFANERQPIQSVKLTTGAQVTIPEHQGQYAQVSSNGYPWRLDGGADFPLGPFQFALRLGFGSPLVGTKLPTHFMADDTRAYSMTNTGDPVQETQRSGSWASVVAACPSCPTAEEKRQHDRICSSNGCTAGFYSNLTDGRLPHEGRRGASGPYWDSGAPTGSDWWHMGKPGVAAGTGRAPGEPTNSVATDGTGATTALYLSIGLSYDVGIADVGVIVSMNNDYRNGVALRDYRMPSDTGPVLRAAEVGIDAEVALAVNARVIINVDIPFFGRSKVFDETIDILKRESNTLRAGTETAASVKWSTSGESNPATEVGTILAYSSAGKSASLDSCLKVPATNETPTPISNPKDFVTKVRDAIPTQLYPCHVKICSTTTTNATTLRSCEWDVATKKLVCQVVKTGCVCGDNKADMCDASGNVYPGKNRLTGPFCEVIG